jgi:AAA domain/DnaB-like helicase N terminal domain
MQLNNGSRIEQATALRQSPSRSTSSYFRRDAAPLSGRNNGSAAEIPADEEAEKCVLGALLTGKAAIEALENEIDPRVFFTQGSRIIFDAIVELHTGGQPLDIIVLTQHLRERGLLDQVGGAHAVTELATKYDKSIPVARHELSVLRELHAKRCLLEFGTKLARTTRAADMKTLLTEAQSAIDDARGFAVEPSDASGANLPWSRAIAKSVVNSTEIVALELQPRERLLGDWLCRGDLGLIHAYRGVGKTWLALLIAKALSQGGTIGPWTAHRKAKVLYVDGEMPVDLMRQRDCGLGSSEDNLIEFLNHEILFERTQKVLNITDSNVQRAITKHCLERKIEVVILDNLSTLASGMKENDSYDWELVNNWLLQFRRHKIAVILIHHAGRNGEARGTSKREDATFWVIALDDAKKQADDKRGARFISRFTKPSRNIQEEVPAYEWHIVTDPVSGEISVAYKFAQSLDVFRRCIEEGVTDCQQIAEEMKVSKATVSRMAKKAMDQGWLGKKGRDYVLLSGNEEK